MLTTEAMVVDEQKTDEKNKSSDSNMDDMEY
jgi:hypothetical protein